MAEFGNEGLTGTNLLSLTVAPDISTHPAVSALRDDLDDHDLAAGIVEIFERARQAAQDGHVNLIVLSARRLACLYQLALANGLAPINECLVVSDRFLDIAPQADQWRWNRVLVLDDSVVLGTTLHNLVRDLTELIPQDGVVMTAAVVRDAEQVADFLIEGLNFSALYERTRAEVETFSLNVVQALFRYQIPFFSDFPVTTAIEVAASEWQDYLARGPWSVADVSAPLIADESRSALVLVPDDAMVDAVLTRLPPQVGRLIDSFKLRAYVIRLNQNRCRLRLVPIAMLRPARSAELDEAVSALAALPGMPQSERHEAIELTPEAKHRIVQLFASVAVLAAYVGPSASNKLGGAGSEYCPALAELRRSGSLDSTVVGLYFGGHADSALRAFDALAEWVVNNEPGSFQRPYNESAELPNRSSLLQSRAMRQMLWEQRELLDSTQIPEAPHPGQLTKIGLIFGSSLSSVFGFISRTFEIGQREEIKKLGSVEEFRSSGLSSTQRVLNQGLTLSELTGALCPELSSGPTWTRSLMSLGVDIGNDLGIIVPATQLDNTGLVYRCYRLGETAYLADIPLPLSARLHAGAVTTGSDRHRAKSSWWSRILPAREASVNIGRYLTDWDALARSALSGYPLVSYPLDIYTSWWSDLADEAASKPTTRQVFTSHTLKRMAVDGPALERLAELQRIVLRAVPGEVQDRFEGYVTDIEGDEFEAQLVQSADGATGTATFPVDLVEEREKDWLREGAEFVWTVYDESAASREQGPISRIRFVKHRPLDREAMERAARALAADAGPAMQERAL